MTRLAVALLALVAAGCAPPRDADSVSDRSAIEATLRQWPVALQAYDHDAVAGLVDSTTVWIEHGTPMSIATVTGIFRSLDSMAVAIRYGELRDLRIGVQGDIAWAHWLADGTFTTDTDAGRAWFRNFTRTTDPTQREWKFNWVESAVLRRSDGQWRFVFGHTTRLPSAPN